MAVETCPADVVNASVDKVWSLLASHQNMTVGGRLTPPASTLMGQPLLAKPSTPERKGSGKRWTFTLQVEAVAPEKHQIRFRTMLPLGISGINQITCTALGPSTCRVQYG